MIFDFSYDQFCARLRDMFPGLDSGWGGDSKILLLFLDRDQEIIRLRNGTPISLSTGQCINL